jgi:hypothetical protein
MHAAEGSLSVAKRDAALCQLGTESITFKFRPTPSAREEPPLVAYGIEVDLEYASQFSLMKDHDETDTALSF